jgi:hypothetical protein
MNKVIRIKRKDIAHRLRQVLREGREHRRELTLYAKEPGDKASLEASGAIRLTINDLLPTVDNSLGLPQGLELEMGVTGGQVWPVSIDDAEIEEEDETVEMTDQTLSFAQIRSASPQRAGVTVMVSNRAIDSASFDLLSFVQAKFVRAVRKYIAAHLYSSADFGETSGPFSSKYADEWELLDGNLFDAIQAQMTIMEQEGFDTSQAVILMTPSMEVKLKCTPIRAGEGRMVIQDGLCAGYPYITNNYFNQDIDQSTGKLKAKDTDTIGIGIFRWWKICQHDTATVRIDGKSEKMAKRNVTAVTLNTAWSFTNLAKHVNGASGGLHAFRTITAKRLLLADCDSVVFRTSDGKLLTVPARV